VRKFLAKEFFAVHTTQTEMEHVFGQCEAEGCGCRCWLPKGGSEGCAVRLCNHLKEEHRVLFLKNGCQTFSLTGELLAASGQASVPSNDGTVIETVSNVSSALTSASQYKPPSAPQSVGVKRRPGVTWHH
jgi:hypothetical protein